MLLIKVNHESLQNMAETESCSVEDGRVVRDPMQLRSPLQVRMIGHCNLLAAYTVWQEGNGRMVVLHFYIRCITLVFPKEVYTVASHGLADASIAGLATH